MTVTYSISTVTVIYICLNGPFCVELMVFLRLCRISSLETCWGSSKTATAGRSSGWSSPTSACSSTSPTRWDRRPCLSSERLPSSGIRQVAAQCRMSNVCAIIRVYRRFLLWILILTDFIWQLLCLRLSQFYSKTNRVLLADTKPATLPGWLSPGQPSSAGLLCQRSLRLREHSQGLRLQASFQVPHLLLPIREWIHVWEVPTSWMTCDAAFWASEG